MVTIIDEGDRVSIPSWVKDIDSFRRWTDADDFPNEHRIWWLQGEVCIDMSKEQIFTHVRVSKNNGWAKSMVFGKAFRLTSRLGSQGHPDYALEVR